MNENLLKNSEQESPIIIWDKCLLIIRDNVNRKTYNTWFEPIKAVNYNNGTLTIQVPSQFFYEWIEEHFVDLLGKTLRRVIGEHARLNYKIKMDNSDNPATMNLSGSTYPKNNRSNYIDAPMHLENPHDIKNPFIIPGMQRMKINSQLNPKYTFANYIQGDSNRLARSAALRIAQQPGTTAFNPCVIFGGTGCGKTHLLHAIGNEVKVQSPNKNVLYVSTEKFINQFQDHSKNNKINDFIHFYQLIDVLLIDDIQIFINAVKSQDALFAIFNHLKDSGKQMVFTSDQAPINLQGLSERLITRFKWGLLAEIQVPDFDTRKQILHSMALNEGVELPEDVVDYMAFNIKDNLRDIEGSMISLLAQSTLTDKEIDLDLAKQVIKNYTKNSNKELEIADILKIVGDHYNISLEKLKSKSRKKEIVEPRQIAMFLCKNCTNSTLKNIGDEFSGKDHTTVLHSLNKVQDLMDVEPKYKETVQELMHKVKLQSM